MKYIIIGNSAAGIGAVQGIREVRMYGQQMSAYPAIKRQGRIMFMYMELLMDSR